VIAKTIVAICPLKAIMAEQISKANEIGLVARGIHEDVPQEEKVNTLNLLKSGSLNLPTTHRLY